MNDARKAHTTSWMLISKMVVTYPPGADKRGKTKKRATSLVEGMVRRILAVSLR